MAAGDITAKRANYSDFPCNVFDGVDDYVEVPHAPQQLGANLSNGFTISFRINARSYGQTAGRIFDKTTGTAAQDGFHAIITSGNLIQFQISGGAGASSAANSIPYGQWKHVLITISSAQLVNFYINGVLSGPANHDLTQPLSAITTTNAIRIGNRATATDRTFDGGIRSVKMWNRVLTATERAEDYAGTCVCSGLIHNFKLGGDYKDYGSVGVTATNSGSIANNTLSNKIKTDARQLNLGAASDKILRVSLKGRDNVCKLISANRAEA